MGERFHLFMRNRWVEVGVVGVLAFALFFAGTARIPILGLDEGRFSQASREMLHRGDPVVPTFLGEGRYHKPILIYWCTMASYSVFGVNERAARLPSNIAGTLAVMLLAWAARRRFGAGAGLLAGMALTITPVFHVQAKACTADMVLFLPVLAVMLAFECIVAGPCDWRPPLVFWAGTAVAILAKGPIAPLWVLSTAVALWAFGRRWWPWELAGMTALLVAGAWSLGPAVLVVPAAAAGWHLVRSEEGRQVLRRLRFGWGVPLMLVLILPWLVAVEISTGGAFLREAVGTHVVSRSVNSFESHGFFPGFYLVTAALVAFPWFALLVDALRRGRSVLGDSGFRYLAAWLIGPWILMELVQTKLVHYWMPSYPAGILLVVGWVLAARTNGWRAGWSTRIVLLAGGVLIGLVPVGLTVYLGLQGSLLVTAVVAAAVLILATIAAGALGSRRPAPALAMVVVGSAVYFALLFGAFLPEVARQSLPLQAGRRATEIAQPGEQVIVFKPRDDDLYFYLPMGSRSCGGASCLAQRHQAGEALLGLARSSAYELLQTEWSDVEYDELDRVAGIDLSRVERDEMVIFRVREPDHGRPGIPRNVDRRRAPS